MSANALLVLLMVFASVVFTSCERCASTTIGFRTKYVHGVVDKERKEQVNRGKRCKDFGADFNPVDQSYGRNTYEGICKMEICGDGRAVDGYYCGRGDCNVLGYNCDGGCIPGKPVESFKALHGDKVWDVRVL